MGRKRKAGRVKVTLPDGTVEIRKPGSFQKRKRKRRPSKRQRYDKYMRSPEWKARRAAVLKRDGHRCVRCGSPAELQVHHRTYEHFMDEPLHELETLCKVCHEEEHGRRFK